MRRQNLSKQFLFVPAALLATLAAGVRGETSLRSQSALQSFSALPQTLHPRDGATLGLLTEGRVSGLLGGDGQLGMAVSAPHVQVLDERGTVVRRDPGDRDSILWRGEIHRLQLGTGLSLGSLGLAGKHWDLAAGVALVRQEADAESGKWAQAPEAKTTLEPSLALRTGDWSWGAALRSEGELALRVGKDRRESALSWGGELGLPTQDGREVTARLALRKGFSDAFAFQSGVSTSYRNREDVDGAKRFQRQSLGLQLGTSLRLRPWLEGKDPAWLKGLVDPLHGSSAARYLWDWELALQTRWEVQDADAKTSVTLSRWF